MAYPQRLFTQGCLSQANASFLTHPGNRVNNMEVMGSNSITFASTYGGRRAISGLTPQVGAAGTGFSSHSFSYGWRLDGWGDSTGGWVQTTNFQHHLHGLNVGTTYPFIAGFFIRTSTGTVNARAAVGKDVDSGNWLITGNNTSVDTTGAWVTVKGTIHPNYNHVYVGAREGSTTTSARTVWISSFFLVPDFDALFSDGKMVDYTIEGVVPVNNRASTHGYVAVYGDSDFVDGGAGMRITPSTASGSTNWKMSQTAPSSPGTYMGVSQKSFGTAYGWPYRKVGEKLDHREWLYGLDCAINCIEHVRDLP